MLVGEKTEVGNWAPGETAPLGSILRYELFSFTGPEWRQGLASSRVLSDAAQSFPGFGA